MAIVAMSFQKHWKDLSVPERKALLRKHGYYPSLALTVPTIYEVSPTFIMEVCNGGNTGKEGQQDTDRE
jgi:hypothetical protein